MSDTPYNYLDPSPGGFSFIVYRGYPVCLKFCIYDADDAAIDLEGWTVTAEIFESFAAGEIISTLPIAASTSVGCVVIKLTADDADALPVGRYELTLTYTDPNDTETICTGSLVIQ